eukprot:TRINITY_DN963_c0_g1_i1.p1 TRINITY_DN963_c0_g1~~TRINITY_DN963_c0_g1_i1.p1  ORF type:complete len:388 (+),score=79.33 TRINITY_DN963_c0_g1_i1:125-1288(+)
MTAASSENGKTQSKTDSNGKAGEQTVAGAIKEVLDRVRGNLRVILVVGEGPDYETAAQYAAKDLSTVRKVLVGEGTEEAQKELRIQLLQNSLPPQNEVVPQMICCPKGGQCNLITLLVKTLRAQEFECRKDTEAILVDLLANTEEAVDQLTSGILQQLCEAYEWCNYGAVALNSGNILRQALKHEVIARRLLNHPTDGDHSTAMFESSLLRRFFRYVNVVDFEVASDAFWTFREALIKHPALTADYLNVHYSGFFCQMNRLLQPQQNYVTRRQSLKVLGELLLSRENFDVMQRFTQSTQQLKSVMTLLKDSSVHIKYEAFHVFKLFVANPKKTDDVKLILSMNKDKLLDYFESFGESAEGSIDPALQEEKNVLIREIKALPAVAKSK